MPCNKSYSKEHSFASYGENRIKCTHCGFVQKLKEPKVKNNSFGFNDMGFGTSRIGLKFPKPSKKKNFFGF